MHTDATAPTSHPFKSVPSGVPSYNMKKVGQALRHQVALELKRLDLVPRAEVEQIARSIAAELFERKIAAYMDQLAESMLIGAEDAQTGPETAPRQGVEGASTTYHVLSESPNGISLPDAKGEAYGESLTHTQAAQEAPQTPKSAAVSGHPQVSSSTVERSAEPAKIEESATLSETPIETPIETLPKTPTKEKKAARVTPPQTLEEQRAKKAQYQRDYRRRKREERERKAREEAARNALEIAKSSTVTVTEVSPNEAQPPHSATTVTSVSPSLPKAPVPQGPQSSLTDIDLDGSSFYPSGQKSKPHFPPSPPKPSATPSKVAPAKDSENSIAYVSDISMEV